MVKISILMLLGASTGIVVNSVFPGTPFWTVLMFAVLSYPAANRVTDKLIRG